MIYFYKNNSNQSMVHIFSNFKHQYCIQCQFNASFKHINYNKQKSMKMNEFQNIQQEEASPNSRYITTKRLLIRKSSVDFDQFFSPRSPSFQSFSKLADDHFLISSNTNQFSDPLIIESFSLGDRITMNNNTYNSSENYQKCLSPSTPTSFGFKQEAFRIASVTLKHMDCQKIFPSTHLYLVNDFHDSRKAGLLFKYEGVQVDLKIWKNQGKQLEKNGQLKNFKCQLWHDNNLQWTQVQATITLQIL